MHFCITTYRPQRLISQNRKQLNTYTYATRWYVIASRIQTRFVVVEACIVHNISFSHSHITWLIMCNTPQTTTYVIVYFIVYSAGCAFVQPVYNASPGRVIQRNETGYSWGGNITGTNYFGKCSPLWAGRLNNTLDVFKCLCEFREKIIHHTRYILNKMISELFLFWYNIKKKYSKD